VTVPSLESVDEVVRCAIERAHGDGWCTLVGVRLLGLSATLAEPASAYSGS
jgi:hypothetical protein